MKITLLLFALFFAVFTTQQVSKLGVTKILQTESDTEVERVEEGKYLTTKLAPDFEYYPLTQLILSQRENELKSFHLGAINTKHNNSLFNRAEVFLFADCSPPILS